jgi:hypothetical protein
MEEERKNCVRVSNGKERLWLREGREERKEPVRSTQRYSAGTAGRGRAAEYGAGTSTCVAGTRAKKPG